MSAHAYAFLAHPPQKQIPSQPLPPVPTRPRSHTFTARISSWQKNVQPGTPAPISPARRTSIVVSRNRSGSHSFLTPTTPSVNKQFNPDLTSLGYTSVFELTLPLTPNHDAIPVPSTPPSRKQDTATMAAPINQMKKAKYTSGIFSSKKSSTTRHNAAHPPPLSNDLLLMQFADGGSLESHAKRIMEKRAKEARGSRPSAVGYNASACVDSVYRDEKGAMWLDAEEEMEYAHLLEESSAPNDAFAGWVSFKGSKKENVDVRRGSAATVISSSSSSSGDDVNMTLGLAAVKAYDDDALAAFSIPAFCPPFITTDSAFATPRRGSQGDITILGNKAKPRRGKDRRRPTPLKISSSTTPLHIVNSLPPASAPARVTMYRLDTVRKEFLDASFAPVPASPPTVVDLNELDRVPTSETFQSTKTISAFAGLKKVVKKKSTIGMRGLWKGLSAKA